MKWTNVAIVIALFGLFAIAGGWRHLAAASSPAVGAGGVLRKGAAPRPARPRGRDCENQNQSVGGDPWDFTGPSCSSSA